MPAIRTLVVDDEPLARSRITSLLAKDSEIIVIGECRNGKEAIAALALKEPELVFLDIQMPDMDGFSVLYQSQLKAKPVVIFVTAYDQYALKAFDVHATDYLLKPYDNERFTEALDLAKAQIRMKASEAFNQKLLRLLKEYPGQNDSFLQGISLKHKGRSLYLAMDDIYWIETSGNYLTLHLAEKSYLHRSTLQELESQLDPRQYIRIHRSLLVNRYFVNKVHYLNNNEYEFRMKNGKVLVSGRSFKEKIEAFLSA